jgi:hypothetical protein
LRNVVESGVSHVMDLFLKHATSQDDAARAQSADARLIEAKSAQDHHGLAARLVEVECDEARLDAK